jgi:hypothetical protein
MHDERNKANAQHSTGPITEEGKAASAQNSTKHGIFAQVTTLLPEESQEVYDGSVQGWLAACNPLNEPEKELVLHIVDLNWRLARVSRWETKILSAETPDFKALNTISLHAARMRKQISSTMKDFCEMHRENTELIKKALEEAITVHQADIIRNRPSTVAAAGFVFTIDELEHAIHLAEHLRQSKEIVEDHKYEIDIDEPEDFVMPSYDEIPPEDYDDDLLDRWKPSEDKVA